MTNLAKFTQIRPVTSRPLPEITDPHVRIIEGDIGVVFADSRSLTFNDRQQQARAHVAGAQFAQRAAAVTRFLNGETLEIETAGTGLPAVPGADVCRTASILSWINPAAGIAPHRLAGASIGPPGRGALDFPSIWRADLLALLLLPGLYPDYRRFLAMLLRLCVIVARAGAAGSIDFEKQLADGRPVAGSILAKLVAARLLFPSWIVADVAAATPKPPVAHDGHLDHGLIDATAVGRETAQISATLSPDVMLPARLDPVQLPKVTAIAEPRVTPTEPRVVPIIGREPSNNAPSPNKGGSRNA